MNRYWQSNLVYGPANGMDINWLLRLDKGLPKEDITLVILVNPSISAKRARCRTRSSPILNWRQVLIRTPKVCKAIQMEGH